MPTFAVTVLGAICLACCLLDVDGAKRIRSLSEDSSHLDSSQRKLRIKRFSLVDTFIEKISDVFSYLTGDTKEKFVREMYVTCKNYASEGRDGFVAGLKHAADLLPEPFKTALNGLIYVFVNYIWSDDGNSPGFQKLRQLVFAEADKMGISGANQRTSSVVTSLTVCFFIHVWRVLAF